MYDKFKDYPLMNDRKGSVPLFYPHIPKSAIKSLKKVLSGTTVDKLLSILYLMRRHKTDCTPLGPDSYQLFDYHHLT